MEIGSRNPPDCLVSTFCSLLASPVTRWAEPQFPHQGPDTQAASGVDPEQWAATWGRGSDPAVPSAETFLHILLCRVPQGSRKHSEGCDGRGLAHCPGAL